MRQLNHDDILNQSSRHNERGVISIFAAVSIVAVIGVAALSIDAGHLMVERSNMQSAVDAGALHAAQSLVSGGTAPNFGAASGSGKNSPAYIATNQNDGIVQGDTFTVKADYWQNLSSSAKNNDPAVQVTYTKNVPMYLAKVIGIGSVPVTTTATAIIQPGTSLGVNGTNMPLAVSQCVINQYYGAQNSGSLSSGFHYASWSPTTSKSMILADGDGNGGQGQPFTVGPNVQCHQSQSSTALFSNLSNNKGGGNGSYVNVLNNGNPLALSAGSNIYFPNGQNQGNNGNNNSGSIDSGFHYASWSPGSGRPMMLADGNGGGNGNNIYQSINQCSQNGNGNCGTVIVPIVSNAAPGSSQQITGFACVNILSANNNGITMSFATGCSSNSFASSNANSYGVYSPPQLAQ